MGQLEDMYIFLRIVETGSITKAAEQMNTAVPLSFGLTLAHTHIIGLSNKSLITKSKVNKRAAMSFYRV